MQYQYSIPKGTQAVMGIPTGKLQNLDSRVSTLESGGGGFTVWTATETISGTPPTNTVFTFASATAKPSFIIADNAQMRATTSAGTVNWTWNAGTKQATMSIPPQDDIVAIK